MNGLSYFAIRLVCFSICLPSTQLDLKKPKGVVEQLIHAVDSRNLAITSKLYKPRTVGGKKLPPAKDLFAASDYITKSSVTQAVAVNAKLVYVEYLIDAYRKKNHRLVLEIKMVAEVSKFPNGEWRVTVAATDAAKVDVSKWFPDKKRWNHSKYLELHRRKQ